jgi:hypothetical protein
MKCGVNNMDKSKTLRIILYIALFAFWANTTLAVKEKVRELPKYDCVWAAEPIRIDACLDEPVWNKAQEVELLLTDTEEKPDNPTKVKLLWNNNYLYIGYFCIDSHIWATIVARDGDLYTE